MKPLSAALRLWLGGALVAVLAVSGAPARSSGAPADARPAPDGAAGTWIRLAQADTTGVPAFEGDEEEEEEDVPIPPNLQDSQEPQDPKSAPPDTSGAAAARDSAGVSLPALPDTLHIPDRLPSATQVRGAPDAAPPPAAPKPKGGIFGLAPIVVILGLAAIHVLVIRAAGG
jgi:hypothetical protein